MARSRIMNLAYFNSRPSARGDCGRRSRWEVWKISIHAPPRGATSCGGVRRACRADFNSRPSARGDGSGRRIQRLPCHFNSRPSARGDHPHGVYVLGIGISIHAPPRGATDPRLKGHALDEFQFTPLREGRPKSATIDASRLHFNSRPSARGDAIVKILLVNFEISIHAPPRGATLPHWHVMPPGTQFQFTPLREGRPTPDSFAMKRAANFNSRPSARGDAIAIALPAAPF